MNIELSELGRHEAWLRISSIVKAGDKHIQLERKLTSELLKNWRENYETALKELFSQLPVELSSQATEIITQRLAESLGQSFGSSQKVRDEFRKYITRAYESGKSEFSAKSDLSLPDIRAIDVLTKHNCYWLGEHYGKHIGPKIAELTQDALRDGLGRDELAKELRESLGGKVGGYKYWDVVSSAALVRSRSFGCISGMVEAGITEYEILAMGDERMCPICGEMHGKTFSVLSTREVIERTLGITDPEKFKEAMPWHTEPPTGVGNDKLVADGMSIPPFHGRCRCVLISSESSQIMEAVESKPEPDHPVEMIRGVLKDEIDRLRGVREHGGENTITVDVIMKDYKRVGIEISREDAKRVHDAVQTFTGTGYSQMRQVFLRSLKGKIYPAGSEGHRLFEQYKLCDEYTKIAPTYQGTGKEIFRGIANSGSEYSQKLLGLKPGSEFDLQMPSSFTSDRTTARGFAGISGILLHVSDTDILDAPSIEGMSVNKGEYEVLVSDRKWEVVKVEDSRLAPGQLFDFTFTKDGMYHITLKRKE